MVLDTVRTGILVKYGHELFAKVAKDTAREIGVRKKARRLLAILGVNGTFSLSPSPLPLSSPFLPVPLSPSPSPFFSLVFDHMLTSIVEFFLKRDPRKRGVRILTIVCYYSLIINSLIN